MIDDKSGLINRILIKFEVKGVMFNEAAQHLEYQK